MQYTPNYNLITVEGTDVVNPLVQMNPNFTDIDAAMFANKQATIGNAAEVTSGSVHAITRSNPDSNYFRFTATSNWTIGDSMTVDGSPVSVFLTDGTLPGTGSYVINSEVFGILAGSRVTLFVNKTTIDAVNVSFNPAGTDLTATDADGAIKELTNRFIETASADLYTMNAAGDSWTATQDCWAIARAKKDNDQAVNPQVTLDGNIQILNVLGTDYGFAVFPVMKGQTVTTRNVADATYYIRFRAMTN